jgi:hypothetical protein
MTSSTAVEWASLLVGEGLRCFPCRQDKRPATPNGFHDATDNREKLIGLWDERRDVVQERWWPPAC